MDDLCNTRDTLAVGAGKRLHDWRIHSYPACSGNRCGAYQSNFRTQTVVIAGLNERKASANAADEEKVF